jgi:threonine aldolase
LCFFDPSHAWEFERRKRNTSNTATCPHRPYLEGDLWHELAGMANASGQRLANGLRKSNVVTFLEPEANLMFFEARGLHKRCRRRARSTTSWDHWTGNTITRDGPFGAIGPLVLTVWMRFSRPLKN